MARDVLLKQTRLVKSAEKSHGFNKSSQMIHKSATDTFIHCVQGETKCLTQMLS